LIQVASGSVYDQVIVSGKAKLAGRLIITPYNGYRFAYGEKFGFKDDEGAPAEDAYTADEKLWRKVVTDLVGVIILMLLMAFVVLGLGVLK
jgi:hypothetical protein